MIEQLESKFTKYELARILGARALQIAMDAPLLLKISEKELEDINYNPIEIAKRELVAGVLPITVNKPMPKRKEGKIKKLTKEEIEALKKSEPKEAKGEGKKEIDDKDVEAEEKVEEKRVSEDAEIMELSTPEDEAESTEAVEGEEEA